jgi:hypothetical protein
VQVTQFEAASHASQVFVDPSLTKVFVVSASQSATHFPFKEFKKDPVSQLVQLVSKLSSAHVKQEA